MVFTARSVCFVLILALLRIGLPAQEVQRHGLIFENWICDTFFDGYRPTYTEKWDVPAAVNQSHGGIPVNPKMTKHGTPVYLGDALRQFDVNEPFWLIVGYWKQRGQKKEVTHILAARIEPQLWRKLWHPIMKKDLEHLDAAIKNRTLDYIEARRVAQEIKSMPPFTHAVVQMNPKIDSRGQRRLQCSLRFSDVVKFLDHEGVLKKNHHRILWGEEYPGELKSPPRVLRKRH